MEEHDNKLDIQNNGAPMDGPDEPAYATDGLFADLDEANELDEEIYDGLSDEDFDRQYIWDEYTKILYEDLTEEPKKKEGKGFEWWLALGVCALALALALIGWQQGGKTFTPTSESQSSSEEAGTNTEQSGAAEEDAQGGDTEQSQGDAESTEGYVPTAILVNGKVEGILASEQAAYALVEEVKTYFGDMTRSKGEGELITELIDEITYSPAEATQEVESYESLFAKFTGRRTPIKVKCTLTTQEREEVGYKTSEKKDKFLLEGTSIVVSAGRPGAKVTITHVVYINGDKSNSRSDDETQIIEAQDRVIRVGTQRVKPSAKPGTKEGKKGPKTELVFNSPMPDAKIASNFGQVNGVMHLGLDYVPNEGAGIAVLSSAEGVVAAVMSRGGYGLMVEVDHGDGFTTRYTNLASTDVSIGDKVTAGQIIGQAGQSGNADSVMLHFELRIDGEAYNPRYYLD